MFAKSLAVGLALSVVALSVRTDLNLSGHSGEVKGRDLHQSEVARSGERSKPVIVAIIDTGIDENHDLLRGRLWENPGESGLDEAGNLKAFNGIDDDQNGLIDDIHGWNFFSNNADVTDRQGHGTHIAGIIAAEGKNDYGLRGIHPDARLMILKYYDQSPDPAKNLRATIQSILYAVQMGAKVINYSGGGNETNAVEKKAIELAMKLGVLFVAAAGNDHANSDRTGFYPANYGFPNIISVAAMDLAGELLATSNYGFFSVDLAAPGKSILSTMPGNSFGKMTGTSQATAFVSGLAAKVWQENPTFTVDQVKQQILGTGKMVQGLKGKIRSEKTISLRRARVMKDRGIDAFGERIAEEMAD